MSWAAEMPDVCEIDPPLKHFKIFPKICSNVEIPNFWYRLPDLCAICSALPLSTTSPPPTSFPELQCEDEGRDEEALVWAGQFCILIG
jgi:hypothetical protein